MTSLSAWDGCGHEVVATIAYEQLSAEVKTKVYKIFSDDPRGRTFIDAATWPDDIKQGKRNDAPQAPLNKSWHYVDLPYHASDSEIADVLSNGGVMVNIHKEQSANVVTAITFYANYLKAGHGTKRAKADALSFLIHYVGDVHQPLHCITVEDSLPNYTPPEKGDLGSNGFAIHHHARELHALWDDTFDEPTDDHGAGRDILTNISAGSSVRPPSEQTLLPESVKPTKKIQAAVVLVGWTGRIRVVALFRILC